MYMKTTLLLLTTLSFGVLASEDTKVPKKIQVETRTLTSNKAQIANDEQAIGFDAAPTYQTRISITQDGQKKHQCDQLDVNHLHHHGEQ